MLRRRREINTQLSQFMDVPLLAACFWAAHQIRWRGTFWFDLSAAIRPFEDFFWMLAIVLPALPLILEGQGFYEGVARRKISQTMAILLRSFMWTGIVIAGCSFFLKLPIHSRAVLLLFALLAGVTLFIKHQIVATRLRRRAAKGVNRERVIVAGDTKDREGLLQMIAQDLESSLHVVDEMDLDINGLNRLRTLLHKHGADRVFFAAGHSQLNMVEAAIQICESEGVDCSLFADFFRTSIAKPTIETYGTRPILSFRCTPDFSWAMWLKEVLDRVGAATALLVLCPLLLVVSVLVKLTSPGPIFFIQMRSGKHGRPFRMFKFRTMYQDAEQRRAELEALNQMSGPVFKLEEDPRVTPLGKWLRRTSVDELPQLVNVLLGQMSLVGPRPLPVYETEGFTDPAQRRRLSVRPGLTCLWQISGRNKVSKFEDWVRLDLEYIDNWSLWLDIKILLKTIPVVLTGLGAR